MQPFGYVLLFLTFVSLVNPLATPVAAHANELSVQEIIENVRANEKLYEEIDISMNHRYRVGDDSKIDKAVEGGFQVFSGQESKIHFVGQSGMFRSDRQGAATSPGGSHTLDRIRAFDGTATRLYDQNAIGNLIDARSEDENVIRPHMLLLRFMQYFVPLSTYMSGHQAMSAHPNGNWQSGYTIETKQIGVSDFDGLKCHKVWITTTAGGDKPNDRWELWLAEDRNFIPSRILGYTFRVSETEPVSEGSVKEWREVEPGVWFPVETSFTAFDQRELKATGTRKTQWTDALTTNDVSMHPQFDKSYFSNVPFPNGTAVYEVKGGKTLDGHIQGAPASPSGPAPSSMFARWWLLWLNLAVVAAALIGAAFLKSRRSRT